MAKRKYTKSKPVASDQGAASEVSTGSGGKTVPSPSSGPKSKKNYNNRRKKNAEYKERRARKEDSKPYVKSPFNDISWYNANPNLTIAAASVPYPYRPGMSVDFKGTGLDPYIIPGVMGISWFPSVGYAATVTDPISIAAKEIYGKVRDAFSGSLDADAPDYIMYLMALDSIFAYIGSLKRVYRILNMYNSQNYNVPDTLLYALGVSSATAANLRLNRMQLFQIINELVGMTRKFKCPALFPVFNRHYWLNDNVYADAATPSSQLYAFRQKGYYQFALQKTPEGVDAGGLQMIQSPWFGGSDYTVESLYSFGLGLINALASSDDGYTISGYLTRAYGDVPDFVVDELQMGEIFQPVYLPEVLAQIENVWTVTSLGTFAFSTLNVSQDPRTNVVISKPALTSGGLGVDISPFINIRSDAPTVVDTVEATRMKTGIRDNLTVICGTEVCYDLELWWNGANVFTLDQVVNFSTSSTTGLPSYVQTLCQIEAFDWHPAMMLLMAKDSSPSEYTVYLGMDVQNITSISREQLNEVNKVCLYSEFNSFMR